VVNFVIRRLSTWEITPIPIEYEAGWTAELVYAFWGRGDLFYLPRFEHRTVHSVS